MVWAVLMAYAILASLAADSAHRPPMLYMLGGLCVAGVFLTGALGQLSWAAYAVLWSSAAVAVSRHSGTTASLLLLSAMCYAWGRVAGYDFAVKWTAPLIWADLFGIAALLWSGGPGIARVAGDIVGVGALALRR